MIDANYIIETQNKSLLSNESICLNSKIIHLPQDTSLSLADMRAAVKLAFEKLNMPLLITHSIL